MPVDLDELERLHKAATPEPDALDIIRLAAICDLETTGHVTLSADDWRVVEDLARIGRNACDDGLLERLRTAERERDEADRRAGVAERKLEHLEDRQRKADAWMRERKAEVGVSESAPFDDAWATLASERAALKVENERLREELDDAILAYNVAGT